MSQAATKLIADYLGVDLKEETTNEITSELPNRVTQIEQELEELKRICQDLSEKFENLQIVEQQKGNYFVATVAKESTYEAKNRSNGDSKRIDSELLSESPNETQDEQASHQAFEFDNELIEQTHKPPGGLSGELKSKLLNYDVKFTPEILARRLKVSAKYIGNQKADLTSEEFTKWTTRKDFDGIGWKPIREGKKTYYVPAYILSTETKSRLLTWEEVNGK